MARKAADGKPLHGLEPDLKTASVVVRIFTAFLPGYGIYAIAEGLTRDGIARPSAHDPRRNPHRDTRAWAKSAVRATLNNPRYTGRQVWNRQKKHESLLDITDVSLGYTTKMRWNTQDKWIISKKIVHTPLIDDDTFARAQDIFHSKTRTGPAHGVQRTRRPYLLRGALICGACERKMQGHWSHEQAYYRCRYPNEYGLANHVQHPRNLYVREAWVTRPLDDWPAKTFLPHRIDKTVDLMTATGPDTGHPDTTESTQARADIARCDAKLATHRSALEAGADPGLVTRWITDAGRTGPGRGETTTSPHRRNPESRGTTSPTLIRTADDLSQVIHQAAPTDKAEIYQKLGLRIRYTPAQQKVLVEAHLNQHIPGTRGVPVGVRGGCRAQRTMFRRWWRGRWRCRRAPS
ncbi:recombinase family protein [Streptomyces sp. NBC_01775]|uniref:recombinase family protein n=1 Tax=Streptomyces sp. NBC_01775 TaxID=2975939 RepID=UPI002DD853EA|nr:recombinase family protein [Streptomyces sp. NBC_01775]WSB75778.1 recombinase family protein [Streptomyces sp. NBC_01775]